MSQINEHPLFHVRARIGSMYPASILSLLIAIGGVTTALAEPSTAPVPLEILTEEWAPITFEQEGQASGFAVDVVKAIQARLQTNDKITVVPWARGFHVAKSQPNVVLFTMIRNQEREKDFTMLGPLAKYDFSLYGLADDHLKIKNIEDAKHIKGVAAKTGTLFATNLEKAGFKNIFQTKNPQQEAQLLIADRVDLISNDEIAINKALEEIGQKKVKLKRYLTIEKGDLYIAFSKGTHPATIQKWKQALEEIKRDGSFATLQQKWLPGKPVLKEVLLVGIGASTIGP